MLQKALLRAFHNQVYIVYMEGQQGKVDREQRGDADLQEHMPREV